MIGAVLRAGTAITDITPPLEVGLLTSSVKGLYEPFKSVRLPLKGRVLVLQSGEDRVAIVALDLLNLNDTSVGGWDAFKRSLSDILDPDNVIVTCTHSHCAPESVALSGLYLTEAYKDWLLQLICRVREAIAAAVASLRECTLSVGSSVLEGFSLQRRIPTPGGIVLSDSVQPIARELMDRGPVDRRVRVVRVSDGTGAAIATVVHAVCHPVHEMCLPHISSEFPGEMCRALEASGDVGMPLFLNGAAGDTNPPTVSWGSEYAHRHGLALAGIVRGVFLSPVESGGFSFIHTEFGLPIRPGSNMINERDARARLNVLRIGQLAIVFLPGEPFVETALDIERNAPVEHTVIVGYCENTIGYLPTENALAEGGYEAGPGKWSFMVAGADEVIGRSALELLEKVK